MLALKSSKIIKGCCKSKDNFLRSYWCIFCNRADCAISYTRGWPGHSRTIINTNLNKASLKIHLYTFLPATNLVWHYSHGKMYSFFIVLPPSLSAVTLHSTFIIQKRLHLMAIWLNRQCLWGQCRIRCHYWC